MANWRLTAKQDVSSPCNYAQECDKKDLKKGFSFIVAAQSTGGPSHQDVVGALLLEGFSKEEAEKYDGGSWKNNFSGEEVGTTDFDRSNQQFKAQQNRNDYSLKDKVNKEKSAQSKSKKEEKKKEKKKKKEGRGWFSRLICWILNKILPSWLSSLLGID